MKDRKFVFASVLIGIFLLTVGLTYAYFSLTVSGNDVAETINVDTIKLELKYTDGKVALIYPSDYMYASSACYDDYTTKGDSFSGNNYRNEKCKSTNWLFDKDDWYWLISPSSNGSCCSMAADIFGHIGYTGVHLASGGLRPSLYLNSDVNYISGNGTISDPFIIE